MNVKCLLILIIAGIHCSCNALYNKEYKKPSFADKRVSRKTRKLHKSLYYLSRKGFGIGHQDDTAYGIGWRHADNPTLINSDIYKLVNDFPAVYGFDIGGIENDSPENLDKVPFETMKKLMIEAYSQGGIITISWHADNPVTDGDSWDATPAVSEILNNPDVAVKYELWISRIADFLKTVKFKGKEIPIVFRPLHEMNGDWFWWGYPNCSPADYIELWKKTISLLKDKHKLHNLIYAYSPNTLNKGDYYLKHYPGDDYVDLLGIDAYDHNNSEKYVKDITTNLEILKSIGQAKNKLYAFTETGSEKIPTPQWFSKVLYPQLKNSGIAWVLFWRNGRTDHYYIPHGEHHNISDFKQFELFPETFFMKDLKNLKY